MQSVAYSDDGGVTWKKYDKNPILNRMTTRLRWGFRDPNVLVRAGGKYLMVVAGGPLRIYSSDNLLDWTFESAYGGAAEYRPAGVGSINSECPDLFPVPVDGDPDNVKWVYTGAGEWYIIGDLEQQEINGRLSWCFVLTTILWTKNGNVGPAADYGRNRFLRGCQLKGPGRPGCDDRLDGQLGTIKTPHRGLERHLHPVLRYFAKDDSGGIRLYQTPVKEYEKLRQEPLFDQDGVVIQDGGLNPLEGLRSDQFELLGPPGSRRRVSLR